MSRQIPGAYHSFEYYTRLVAEQQLSNLLEDLVFIVDRPHYATQQSLWIASAYILKSKIEEDIFEPKVLVATKKDKVSTLSMEALLNPARWNQVIDLKHYGTIDEGKYLQGTVFIALKANEHLVCEREKIFENQFIHQLIYDVIPFIEDSIGNDALQDIKNVSNDVIKDKIAAKFPNFSDIFLRELVTRLRREYR